MAYRALFNTRRIQMALVQRNTLLFPSPLKRNVRFSSNIFQIYRPVQGWSDGALLSWKAIMENWGVLPILIITLGGFTCEVLYTIRNAFTRDDVKFTKGPAKHEILETRRGYKIKPAKNLVFNQKYEIPKGLLEANVGDADGPSEDSNKSKTGTGVKIAAAGTAVVATTAAVIYSGVLS